MNPRLKTRWLTALRSEDYVQGQRGLRTDFGGPVTHCCLGVLCDISGAGKWFGDSYMYNGEPNHTVLTPALRSKLGLSPMVEGTLIVLNDGDGCTFSEIAAWIEENL